MQSDLDELERKIAALISHAQALRAANDTLSRELDRARDRHRELVERMRIASGRLDTLIDNLPR
jgi:FtsZ-binding cell division protein ZapB